VNPQEYGELADLWLSQSPPGERLQEYAANEWHRRPHEGETPPQIVREVLDFSARAVVAVDAAEPMVTAHREEFERLRNDVHCIRALSQHYAAKAEAAMSVLRYRYSRDVADMELAAEQLANSVVHYRTLAELTKGRYRFANSIQTGHRQIPMPGALDSRPANFHWVQLVSVYESELADFERSVRQLKADSALPPRDSAP
jgi:hypothetical protein